MVMTLDSAGRATRRATAVVFLALLACDESGTKGTPAPNVPLAYTRFVNAVADTGGTDWRFIDQIENSPVMFGLPFRSFSPYQATAPGSRRLRVFPASTDISVVSQYFIDVTIPLAAGKYYTIVHRGFARAGSIPEDDVLVIEDDIPTVGVGNIAVRAVHLGTALGNQDVFASSSGTEPLPATPLFAGLAYGAPSSYATQSTGALVLRSTNSGTTTVVATGTAPTGTAADPANNLTAIGGSTIERSVFTGFLFPRSVAGSTAPQSAGFTAPAIVYIVDRHPR